MNKFGCKQLYLYRYDAQAYTFGNALGNSIVEGMSDKPTFIGKAKKTVDSNREHTFNYLTKICMVSM
ncbi:hypothetical protein DS2_04240 [Catenovulum agarivorans DS-2]|uniref:Uncharacterized protein n=1 Tax=Catenovulum agarivorans DS-2 TaxID=1328313 RepID=W7QU40_9ALTE|nr:hypothetical protein DS2_04240 [Catenovulum agarivorans DS-2]